MLLRIFVVKGLTLKFSGRVAARCSRVRTLVPESTRLSQPGSEKRGSAATTQSIAGSTGRACASGTLGVNFGMVDFKTLMCEFRGGEADPLQRRVRTFVPEPTRSAQPGSEKRGCAATMESIAGRTGRACASGTLGVNFGMVDFANLTAKFSRRLRRSAGMPG